MYKTKSPLKRSLLTGLIVFILLLCIILSLVEYNSSQKMVYGQYETYIGGILHFISEDIDADDLEECIQTGVKSPKYQKLQEALDRAKERLPIHFIYIIIPLNTEEYDNVQNVMASASQYEYEYETEDPVELNSLTGDSYSPETAGKYLRAYESGTLSFFIEKSEWGMDYTGLLPLLNSKGERVAALCVDIDIAEIYSALQKNVIEVVVLISLIGTLFILLFFLWADKKITGPIKALAIQVKEFSAKYKERKDPQSLAIDVTSIHTNNEVETLANTVSELGDAIRENAENALQTESELKLIKENLYDVAADLDSLTREYAEDHADRMPSEDISFDMHELGKQITGLKNTIHRYITHTTTQANSMITAMASDYRCVYYVNLDEDDAVCYRDDPKDHDQTPVGVHFPYLERITWYAGNCVTEQYREGFLDFIQPENVRKRLEKEPIIAYRYLAKREGREYYEMIRMAGVRRAEDRDDHMVHSIGLGFTVIDAEMREAMAKNEALAQALARAEEANAAKTAFLSSISHEIRTPMNAIIGLDTIALRDPSISETTREELEKIRSSAQHLLSLINDILDISRIESGRMVLKAEEFSLRQMVEQINTIINGQCEDKRLTYERQIIGPVDEYFIGDDLRLRQIIINILGNAVKFTDPPGTVTFLVEQRENTADSRMLRFTMRDTGVGMDKEFLPKLFEPFSQEDATNTNRYGGSGLGMALTKNMLDLMGGRITVESEKGKGTTFTVEVPLQVAHHVEQQTEAVNQAETDISLAGLHVLIAEDMELNAEILTDLLEMEDISSEWAQNGQLAVEMFSQSEAGHFDFILMDMRMPVMDGLQATREIRKLNRADARSIPIIALTANAFDEDVKQCLEAGMNAHLAKPLDLDQMKELLGRIFTAPSADGQG